MEIRVWFCTEAFNFIAKNKGEIIGAKKGTRIVTSDKAVYVQLDTELGYNFQEVSIDTNFIIVNFPRFFKEI